jgi:hypothetical protein
MAAILLTASIVFGLCIPGAVYGMHVVGYLDRPQLSLFGIGVTLGSVWEFALVVVVPPLLEAPLYTVFAEVPIPSLIHVAVHSFSDGGLFLVGALLVGVFWMLLTFGGSGGRNSASSWSGGNSSRS